jgi:hypothetical protein
MRVRTQTVVFQSHSGAETMTFTTPKMGLLGNSPATSSPSSIARRIAIEAALSLALFHVRNGDTHAAVGRSIRATCLLKQSCSEAKNGGAA